MHAPERGGCAGRRPGGGHARHDRRICVAETRGRGQHGRGSRTTGPSRIWRVNPQRAVACAMSSVDRAASRNTRRDSGYARAARNLERRTYSGMDVRSGHGPAGTPRRLCRRDEVNAQETQHGYRANRKGCVSTHYRGSSSWWRASRGRPGRSSAAPERREAA